MPDEEAHASLRVEHVSPRSVVHRVRSRRLAGNLLVEDLELPGRRRRLFRRPAQRYERRQPFGLLFPLDRF